ncbi:alpha/beta fold hydrolase [Flavobacterium bizetiae]|jgi:pimeloyl-ACP methyl ester carboxylesterase|uniref:alpha/beta fold hydrolase n=1 Tax=Flavobacterium bizetiae TaxID=2704140 RepID=UPI003757FA87
MKAHLSDKIINVNGKKICVRHLLNFRDRPTIVFLHDSLGCITLWRDLPEKLSEATLCNVLIYDRVGYGKSQPMDTYNRPVNYLELEADFLNELLIHLEIKDSILHGHSDGGSIALITAAKYPSKIKALICEAAHVFVEEVTLEGIRQAVHAYKNTNLGERLAKYHGDKADTIFKAWTLTWTRADFRNWNIEYLLKDIGSPLLFIQGEQDEYGSIDQVDKTISQVSGTAQKFIIIGIGHTPHKEAPEQILNVAADFIKQL